MTARPPPSVVLLVANVERVAAFYAAIGAMNLVTRDPEHAVLAIEGFQLVIHRLRGEPEPHIDADGKVRVREDSYAKICLPVDRIDAARSRAVAHGGFIKPAQQEWQVRDFRACDGNDPEGNVIQVRESVA